MRFHSSPPTLAGTENQVAHSCRKDTLLLKPFSIKELREAIELALTQEQPAQTSGLPPITGLSAAPGFILPLES
jgi:DNA-binding response OmpR family regulator